MSSLLGSETATAILALQKENSLQHPENVWDNYGCNVGVKKE